MGNQSEQVQSDGEQILCSNQLLSCNSICLLSPYVLFFNHTMSQLLKHQKGKRKTCTLKPIRSPPLQGVTQIVIFANQMAPQEDNRIRTVQIALWETVPNFKGLKRDFEHALRSHQRQQELRIYQINYIKIFKWRPSFYLCWIKHLFHNPWKYGCEPKQGILNFSM